MTTSSEAMARPAQIYEAAQSIALSLQNMDYALIGGAACSILGSLRQTIDVDLVVPKGQTKAARALLRQSDDFEVDQRTLHTYYKSTPKVGIEILTPPILFKEPFTESTPITTIGQIKVLKPTLLLNAKCGSIVGRDRQGKKDTDAFDIRFLLQWCANNGVWPTASEVPNATEQFVQRFITAYGNHQDWQRARWDLQQGCWSES